MVLYSWRRLDKGGAFDLGAKLQEKMNQTWEEDVFDEDDEGDLFEKFEEMGRFLRFNVGIFFDLFFIFVLIWILRFFFFFLFFFFLCFACACMFFSCLSVCFVLTFVLDFEEQYSTRETFSADLISFMSLLSPDNVEEVVIDACREIVRKVSMVQVSL